MIGSSCCGHPAHGGDEVLPVEGFAGPVSIAAIEYLSEKRTAELCGCGPAPST